LRQLALPRPIRCWTLTILRNKLIQIGAKVIKHTKYVIFQLAEVAVPGQLFANDSRADRATTGEASE
jgi:hypothetical protein